MKSLLTALIRAFSPWRKSQPILVGVHRFHDPFLARLAVMAADTGATMLNTDQIRTRMAELRSNITTLAEVDGDLDDVQRTDWSAFNTEYDELGVTLAERAERAERYAALAADVEDTTPAVNGGGSVVRGDFQVVKPRDAEDIYDLSRSQHFPGSDDYASDMHDRAMRAIDSWPKSFTAEARESAEACLNPDKQAYKGQAAAHIVRGSNPLYLSGFKKIVANPQAGMLTMTDAERSVMGDVMRTALNEGTTTQGGYLVPPMLDPTIILTNNGTINPFREISTVKTITTQSWKGVTSAGVTAEWTAEAAEVADGSPAVSQPTITPVRGDAYVQASMEMIQDTDIAMEVAELLGEAIDRLQSTAFAVGTGVGQPKGIVTAISAVTNSRVSGSSGAAGSADFVLADIYALAAALPPRHRPNASWLGEYSELNRVRRFGEGVTSNAAFWVDLNVGVPPLLLGRPVYQSSEMDSTIVSGSNDDILLIGDFKKYFIIDRIGLEIVYNPLVLGTNRRPTGEVGWVAFFRTGADAVDTNAFRLLRL